jgi:hypothetical protein
MSAFSIGSCARPDDALQGHPEHLVKRSKHSAFPVHDYRRALQSAVSWLGDRYLLAAPVRRAPDRKPFFAETRA